MDMDQCRNVMGVNPDGRETVLPGSVLCRWKRKGQLPGNQPTSRRICTNLAYSTGFMYKFTD